MLDLAIHTPHQFQQQLMAGVNVAGAAAASAAQLLGRAIAYKVTFLLGTRSTRTPPRGSHWQRTDF